MPMASLGGKTRFSTRTDSMALMVVSGKFGIGRYCQIKHLQATDWPGAGTQASESTLPGAESKIPPDS